MLGRQNRRKNGWIRFGRHLIWIMAGCLIILLQPACASMSCTSPSITMPAGGGTAAANIDCTVTEPLVFTLAATGNYVSPSSILVKSGLNTLTGSLLSTISSPDNSYILLAGNASGFVGSSITRSATIRYQYTFTTTASTPQGTYMSTVGSLTAYYATLVDYGSANAIITVIVPLKTAVTCNSAAVNAPGGGGTYTLKVDCLLNGNSPALLSPSSFNTFSPSTMTLTNSSSNTLSATLQPTITSPDNTVSGITGSASGGFTGTFVTSPGTIEAQYKGATTSITPSGTYNSTPVILTWSTL